MTNNLKIEIRPEHELKQSFLDNQYSMFDIFDDEDSKTKENIK